AANFRVPSTSSGQAREHAPRPAEPAPDENKLAELRACFADLENRHQRAFLAGFVAGMGIKRAAALSGVSRTAHYDWMKADRRYRECFERAREMIADRAEAEGWRRASRCSYMPPRWRRAFSGSPEADSDAQPAPPRLRLGPVGDHLPRALEA